MKNITNKKKNEELEKFIDEEIVRFQANLDYVIELIACDNNKFYLGMKIAYENIVNYLTYCKKKLNKGETIYANK